MSLLIWFALLLALAGRSSASLSPARHSPFERLWAETKLSALPTVSNLTVEYQAAPIAIDIDWNPSPRFGWQLGGASPQASYHLVVTATFPVSSQVWDSGIVQSNASTQVSYGGSPLLHFADYVWSVAVTFGDGTAANATSAFGTGLNASEWASSGAWIGGCTSGQAAPSLRANFTLPALPLLRARAYATGLGLYTLSINGARAGGGVDVLTPGWSTVPTARVLADAWDVAPFLVAGGENVVGGRLGQGKYGYVYEFCTAGDATCYALLARVVVAQRAADGTVVTTTVDTGRDWSCAPSPVVFNHLFGGETYDARLEQPGWDAPGFAPTTPWVPAPARAPNVSLVTAGPPPIRVMASLSPATVTAAGGAPYIGGGLFVKSSTSVDVFWVAAPNTTRNHVTACSPCAGIDACGNMHIVPQSFIDGLAAGPDFDCGMLPTRASGAFVADFRRNMAGFCTLALPPAAPGTTVALAHGEILDANGNVHNTFGSSAPPRTCAVNVINCADQIDEYVYGAGGGAAHWTPVFTFHGFRYVAIIGWPAGAPPPDTTSLTCHQVHSDAQPAGGVAFNSTVLNAIQAAIVQTQKSNIFSIPSDCPTREKRGWMGDAQGSADEALSNLRLAAFYESWLRTLSDTLFMSCQHTSAPDAATVAAIDAAADGAASPPARPPNYLCCDARSEFGCSPGLTPTNATGSLPDVVPFDSISGWPGDFVWEVAGEVIPAALLSAEGNVPALRRLWSYITAHLEFVSTAARDSPGGLLRFGPYSDWNAAEPVSLAFAANWYYVRAAALASAMAGALGLPQQAVAYAALADAASAAMVARLFNATSGVWDGAPANANAQAMALAVGLGGAATANASAATAAAMVADVSARGGHPTGGVASVRWILQGLVAAGRGDLALAMALVPTAPSWAYMATPDMPGTIWEAWDGDATHSDGSKNHPMFAGGIGVWLYESAVGLRFSFELRGAGAARARARASPLAGSHLGHDPRVTAGLTDGEAAAVVALSAAARAAPRAPTAAELIAAAAARGIPAARPALPELDAVLTVAPDADVVAALRSASGWRAAPHGRCVAAWALDDTGAAFNLAVTVPSGVAGRLVLPLRLLRAVAAAGGGGAGGRIGVRISLTTAVGGRAGAAAAAVGASVVFVGGGGAPDAGGGGASACAQLGVVDGADVVACPARDGPGSAAARLALDLVTAAEVDGRAADAAGPTGATGALQLAVGLGDHVLTARALTL